MRLPRHLLESLLPYAQPFTALAIFAIGVLACCSGCAKRGREASYHSVIERDAATGAIVREERSEQHDAILSATGYKLALEQLKMKERREEGTSQGPGDWSLEIGLDSAEASPESQLLKGFQAGLQTLAQVQGFGRPVVAETNTIALTAAINALRSELTTLRTNSIP
jgi:hypothetical protein